MSYARDFGHGFALEVSYVGRLARNLLSCATSWPLQQHHGSESGVDFYTAMRQLIALRYPLALPRCSRFRFSRTSCPAWLAPHRARPKRGLNGNPNAYRRMPCPALAVKTRRTILHPDTLGQHPIAFTNNLCYQPQYSTLRAYGTLATSDYHSAQSAQERFTKDLFLRFQLTRSVIG